MKMSDNIAHILDVELDVECAFCFGTPVWYDECDGSRRACGECNGTGRMPTESGKKLLSFIRDHFRHLLEECSFQDDR